MYTLIVFLSSAGALTLEIVAGRLIAPYVGMSLYTWTAVIAVVLTGLSAGHWVGGTLAHRARDIDRAKLYMAVSLVAASITTLLSLPLLRMIASPLLGAGTGPVSAVLLLSSVLFFGPSMCIGVISPLATKLALDEDPASSGKILGRMFAAGALGSILGTLASGYVFISWIGSTGTVIAAVTSGSECPRHETAAPPDASI
ncbi:MAG: fused MFS/spermidine synthase [Rhodospirillales bacterium]